MKKRIVLNTLEFTNYGNSDGLAIKIDNHLLQEWCLSLCLLHYGMIESLVVSHPTLIWEVKINKKLATNIRATGTWRENRLALEITQSEIEYWISFFLQHYREGGSPVDHIDVEVSCIPTKERSRALDLCLQISGV